jgi:hypothetical protein
LDGIGRIIAVAVGLAARAQQAALFIKTQGIAAQAGRQRQFADVHRVPFRE